MAKAARPTSQLSLQTQGLLGKYREPWEIDPPSLEEGP